MEIAKSVHTKIWANFRVKESTTISHICSTVSANGAATDPTALAGNLGAYLPFFPSLHSFCFVLWVSLQPLNTCFQPHYCLVPGSGGGYVIRGSLPRLHADSDSWVQPRKTSEPNSQVSKPWLESSKVKAHSQNGRTGRLRDGNCMRGWCFLLFLCLHWWRVIARAVSEIASSHPRDSSYRLGGGVWGPIWSLSDIRTAFPQNGGRNHNVNVL